MFRSSPYLPAYMQVKERVGLALFHPALFLGHPVMSAPICYFYFSVLCIFFCSFGINWTAASAPAEAFSSRKTISPDLPPDQRDLVSTGVHELYEGHFELAAEQFFKVCHA